ncbi:MAG: bifunctional NADH dehydrogenase FAD-containing subunit/selenide, water dikinase SelD, partial [Pseudomonadales bacterium]
MLIGGGHSHVQVLRAFGMRPLPGVRLTLISREPFTPYSGMLPGHVAGDYDWREIHIDLGPLATFAGARFISSEVTAVDPAAGTLELDGHPPLRYDWLSVNTGAAPGVTDPVGEPVKPIGRFLPRWSEVLSAA